LKLIYSTSQITKYELLAYQEMSLANLSYFNECSANQLVDIITRNTTMKPEVAIFFSLTLAVVMVYIACMNATYLITMELNKNERTTKINILVMENLLKRQNDLEKRNKELEEWVMHLSKSITLNVDILNEHTEILANHDFTHANIINNSHELTMKTLSHEEKLKELDNKFLKKEL